MTAVTSFDVFETVLVRAVGEPSSVFLLLGRRLRAAGVVVLDAAVFAAARSEAEQRARHRRPGLDTRLDLIYRELAHALRLTDGLARRLADAEMELEDELLHASPEGATMVERARRRGDRIMFVSDTYLPESFVEQLLSSRGLFTPGDGLYVSSGHGGADKRSGALFEVIVRTEGVPRGHITHVGNDAIADVERARAAGLRPRPHTAANLRADEVALERHRVATAGFTSVLAGAARLARLSYPQARGNDAVIRDVAAAVAGPTLASFVVWVLREASRRSLSRLYFVARDGQILLELARRLAPKLQVDIDLRYLYVSRRSLNAAAIEEFTATELGWALTNPETETLRTLLHRVGVTPESVADELEELGLPTAVWDEIPDEGKRNRVVRALHEGPLRPALERGVECIRSLALGYLRQEELLAAGDVGLVDATGAGSQLRALARLRRAHGLSAPTAMLLYRQRPAVTSGDHPDDEVLTWYEDQVSALGWGLPPGGPRCSRCSAPRTTAPCSDTTKARMESCLGSLRRQRVLRAGVSISCAGR